MGQRPDLDRVVVPIFLTNTLFWNLFKIIDMPSKKDRSPILADKYYHIYNRGNNFEETFRGPRDYHLFLWLIKKYISSLVEIYAYALLPNHFHILLKTTKELKEREFGKYYASMMIDYTRFINKREGRSGNLFLKPFKRILIDSDEYMKRLVFYIHFNPQKHGLTNHYQNYKFSSFMAFQSELDTLINKKDVFEIFGSKTNFNDFHTYLEELNKLNEAQTFEF